MWAFLDQKFTLKSQEKFPPRISLQKGSKFLQFRHINENSWLRLWVSTNILNSNNTKQKPEKRKKKKNEYGIINYCTSRRNEIRVYWRGPVQTRGIYVVSWLSVRGREPMIRNTLNAASEKKYERNMKWINY